MISAMDISTSALVAQRTRLNAISANLANMSTTRNENGELQPYQARYVTFAVDDELTTSQGASGVKVASVTVSRPSLDDVYLRYAGRAFSEADEAERKKR